MFFNIKKILLICSFFFIISCSLSNKNLPVNSNINLISIETPNDRDNILFNEYLRRAFKPINDVSHKFLLETSISYSITNALSIISKLKPKHYIKSGKKIYDFSKNTRVATMTKNAVSNRNFLLCSYFLI